MGTYSPSTAHAGLAQMVQNNVSVDGGTPVLWSGFLFLCFCWAMTL